MRNIASSLALLAACSFDDPPAQPGDGAPPTVDAAAPDASLPSTTCPTSGGACSKQDGLVAAWTLDEPSDGSASVPRLDATACDNDLADPFHVRSTELAHAGAAALFEWAAEDTQGRLEAADSPSLSMFDSGSFTIALWFELRGTGPRGSGKLLAKGYPESQGSHEVGIEYQVGGACDGGALPHMHAGVYGEDTGAVACVPPSYFDPDQHVDEWHFLVTWHDADQHRLSIQIDDGTVFSKSTAGLTIADTDAVLNLGGYSAATRSAIDDVMIWNRTLTADERASVFASGLACGTI